MAADPALEAAALVARTLTGDSAAAIERVRGIGRNSGVYRVHAGGAEYALKQYPPRHAGERDRAGIEIATLRFLREHGVVSVPRASAADSEQGYALIEWIDGEPVTAPSAADIVEATAFLGRIHALRDAAGADAQPAAAEACLSAAQIIAQIQRRLARLDELQHPEPALAAFLDRDFQPALAQIEGWVDAGYAARGWDFAQPIDKTARALCPADFGFHNVLRRDSGQLVFIDFDYFGWDDPVKLTADFLLHPGMKLSDALKRQFGSAAMTIYQDDATFGTRLALLYPLFGLRWCLILLNEFLPERWADRVNAGGAEDWRSAKERQLDKARQSVQSLAANFRRFPYGE
jgi:hypothetical protein